MADTPLTIVPTNTPFNLTFDQRFKLIIEACLADLGVSTITTADVNQIVSDAIALDNTRDDDCLLYTSPSPRDKRQSRMPSSA